MKKLQKLLVEDGFEYHLNFKRISKKELSKMELKDDDIISWYSLDPKIFSPYDGYLTDGLYLNDFYEEYNWKYFQENYEEILGLKIN